MTTIDRTKVLGLIDDVKTKLTDGEYKAIVEALRETPKTPDAPTKAALSGAKFVKFTHESFEMKWDRHKVKHRPHLHKIMRIVEATDDGSGLDWEKCEMTMEACEAILDEYQTLGSWFCNVHQCVCCGLYVLMRKIEVVG